MVYIMTHYFCPQLVICSNYVVQKGQLYMSNWYTQTFCKRPSQKKAHYSKSASQYFKYFR